MQLLLLTSLCVFCHRVKLPGFAGERVLTEELCSDSMSRSEASSGWEC